MKVLAAALILASVLRAGAVPEGWTESREGDRVEWTSPRAASLLPAEWTLQFRAPAGSWLAARVVAASEPNPLLEFRCVSDSPTQATLSVSASGSNVATRLYRWRKTAEQKEFVLRLVLRDRFRQAWLDGRLVAEAVRDNPLGASLELSFQGAAVEEIQTAMYPPGGSFLPLSLGAGGPAQPESAPAAPSVPFLYGSTERGSGRSRSDPEEEPWPDAFSADAAFSVPNRPWQHAWIVAWTDGIKGIPPKGLLRFYQPGHGRPVDAPFEITEASVKNGSTVKLDRTAPLGQPLHRIRAPIPASGLDALRQDPGPLTLGLVTPGSLHVLAMTLEEAPFDMAMRPARPGAVFERPGKAAFACDVTNRSARPLEVKVRLDHTSLDGAETGTVTGRLALAARAAGSLPLELNPALNGWHALSAQVEADGVVRSHDLALVMLPPARERQGHATNSVRFGLASLGSATNAAWLSLFKTLGLFVTNTPRLTVADLAGVDAKNPKAVENLVQRQLARMAAPGVERRFIYGGGWPEGRDLSYDPAPALAPSAEVARQVKLFESVAEAFRYRDPGVRLIPQGDGPWGARLYVEGGLLKVFADGFVVNGAASGYWAENPGQAGSIQGLEFLHRAAAARKWPRLPVLWAGGPWLSTRPGALTERQQADALVRLWLAGLPHGVSHYETSVVPVDPEEGEAAGAGLFAQGPSPRPKPVVAALATAAGFLNGAAFAGAVDTGVPTTYCWSFRRAEGRLHVLWRAAGRARAVVKVEGKGKPVLTDAMGNGRDLPVQNGTVLVPLGESPVWLTGVESIGWMRVEFPEYAERPAAVTRPLPAFKAALWKADASGKSVPSRPLPVRPVPDPVLEVAFEPGEAGYRDVLAVWLPAGAVSNATRRCVAINAHRPVPIIGNPGALGVWVKGNGGWGRILYRIRDARGAVWTSGGSAEAWGTDDPHGWSFIAFEGWRYLRFPLPGIHPDGTPRADNAWWGGPEGRVPQPPFALLGLVLEVGPTVPAAGALAPAPPAPIKLAELQVEYE